MRCVICNGSNVIYSGIDAFVLGVETEKVCYSCVSTYKAMKENSAPLDPTILI